MKKYISALLAVLMLVVSVTPMTAFASDNCGGITPFSEWDGGNNEFFTSIILNVTDRDGNPIQGAVYALYKWDGTFVQYLTADRNGTAATGEIPSDTDYYLIEVTAPEGYQPNTERKNIILSESCAPSRIEVTAVYDPITGRIKVVKTDENGNPLSGAGFYVYSGKTGSHVDTIITGADGTAVTVYLPYGWYELYEYLVPQGFEDNGSYNSQRIQYDGETAEIYITNYHMRGDVSIYKTGNDGRTVQGAVFSIYTASGVWVEDITTNGGGYAYSSNLITGDYYAVEKSVPAPYALDTEYHYFSLYYSGQRVYLDIENEVAGLSGKIKIIKTDNSSNPLDGVVFGLYRSWDNSKIGEMTTGADGTAESGLLIPGDYYIVELSGKTGYEYSDAPIYVTVDGSGETVILGVINPKIRTFGKVKVIKTDETGTLLPGVTFGVYCHLGNLLEELTTGADGTATSGILNDGDYYIKELDGLPGHIPDTSEHHFSIVENNVIVPITVVNHRITGGLKIIKTDGENPLSGAVFAVFDSDGVKVCELTTGADGTASSGALYYGDYTLRELSTVDGYEFIDTPIPFSITEQGVVIEITVTNPCIYGNLTVYKTDGGGVPLTGVVFGIFGGNNEKIAEITTGEDGMAAYGNLPWGEYHLQELSVPNGYVLLTETIPFEIKTQGETVEITVVNEREPIPEPTDGVIKLTKVDSENGERLTGAVFGVYDASSDILICELTTDENGEAVTPLLMQGEYYLLEMTEPDGYELNTNRIDVIVVADETAEITVVNVKTPRTYTRPN